MPDISMCLNTSCPLKESCYRFTAKANDRQSYSNFQYEVKQGEVKCEFYSSNKKI